MVLGDAVEALSGSEPLDRGFGALRRLRILRSHGLEGSIDVPHGGLHGITTIRFRRRDPQ